MVRSAKYLIPVVLFLLFSASSCESDTGGEFITGGWRCREESPLKGFRQYSVSIERVEKDSTLFKIYNMYNLGFEFETYARLTDTILTILPFSLGTNIAGMGHIHKDLSAIEWRYTVFSGHVTDTDVMALYYRR